MGGPFPGKHPAAALNANTAEIPAPMTTARVAARRMTMPGRNMPEAYEAAGRGATEGGAFEDVGGRATQAVGTM